MNKMNLEIIMSVAAVATFILLTTITAKLAVPSSTSYGYAAALLVFIAMMTIAGLKLAEIPDR